MCVLVFVIAYRTIYRQELVKIGGIGTLIVVSGSMEPTIEPKEMIIIKEKAEYNKDDVITYKDNSGKFITHRIVEVNGEHFRTKGDSNLEVDDLIEIQNIEGKVIFHSYILGIFFLYLLKPLLIIIIVLYLLYVLLK